MQIFKKKIQLFGNLSLEASDIRPIESMEDEVELEIPSDRIIDQYMINPSTCPPKVIIRILLLLT